MKSLLSLAFATSLLTTGLFANPLVGSWKADECIPYQGPEGKSLKITLTFEELDDKGLGKVTDQGTIFPEEECKGEPTQGQYDFQYKLGEKTDDTYKIDLIYPDGKTWYDIVSVSKDEDGTERFGFGLPESEKTGSTEELRPTKLAPKIWVKVAEDKKEEESK